ncbi:MAG TPA: glycoside hydrolase family 2 TIM barrel-domain containing protein [Blastocatellia bacterium]|nr:glycoside hydrolase family 2 TIM barrel-domain containing protein [Blastocatellia bacterium]
MTKLRNLMKAAWLAAALLLVASIAAAQTKLERDWQFLADKAGTLKVSDITSAQGWRAVRVGLSWNAQFDDLRDYMGVAWYRTRLDVPPLEKGKRALLRFGAVDYLSEVFVNGRAVGTHEGGYTPFTIDVTDAVKPGANELVVRVIDPLMDEKENRARFPEMMYNEIPHGKQNWYVQTGGIWQAVWLDIKPSVYIKNAHVVTRPDGTVEVLVSTHGSVNPPPIRTRRTSSLLPAAGQNASEVKATVTDPSGKVTTLEVGGGGQGYLKLRGRVANPMLWSLDQPNLYTLDIRMPDDQFTDRFGFRTFEARDGKLYLNGEPFYMIAALDQDFYPEGIYTPPSEAFVRDEMLKGKRLGLNLLRCHIKVPDPVYLKVADEVGMLVWYEIPSWADFTYYTPKAAARGERIFAEMVERDWNHPSIVIQSVINESWGADLKQQNQRRWLRAAYERAKELTAPLGRLIDDNSACCDDFHIKSDLDDFHQYYSIPDNAERWDKWVADFASRPKWSFSPHGDAERTGREPLLVSEFGNWGLPRLPKALPWWFPRDFGGRAVTRPAGVFERFNEFKFDRFYKNFNALAEESQWHQFISLKHEIEAMRRYSTIQGYVITEFTDINWEVNGLMDMWRNPKVYAAELAKIQQPDVILVRTRKHNYESGERVEMETLLSHYSNKELSGAKVQWRSESGMQGEFDINRPVERASVTALQAINMPTPATTRLRRERFTIVVRGRNGAMIAENSYDLFIYPKVLPAKKATVIFYDPAGSSPALHRALTAAGYPFVSDASVNRQAVMIATKLDDVVRKHLDGGGKAIILADAKEALPANASLKVTPRRGSDLDGNWVTNFNWINPNAAPFNEVAFAKILGFEASATIPQFVIQGVGGADYGDVLSGIFYGWLNNNAALAVQAQVGAGRAFVTTYRFGEYGSDPYSTRLLDAIIRYASGPQFAPKLKLQ